MQTKVLKRILGLFLFTLTLSFVTTDVYAEDKKADDKYNSDACNKVKKEIKAGWKDRYGFDVDIDEKNSKHVIVQLIAPKNMDSSLDKKKIKFKISEIEVYKVADNNGKEAGTDKVIPESEVSKYIIGSNTVLTFSKSIKLDASSLIGTGGEWVTAVTIVPTGDYDDPLLVEKCGENTKLLYLKDSIKDGGDGSHVKQSGYTENGEAIITKDVDCSGDYESRYANDAVLRKFCKAKVNATAKESSDGKTYVFDDDHLTYGSKYKTPATFQCDYNDYIPEGVTGDAYYANASYMYGYIVREVSAGTYAHNYESGADNTDKAKCKIKCEEAVTVEYGPPVASKAGMCFEYKVKVTSVVTCEQLEKPNKPKEDKLCIPAPKCKDSSGNYKYNQGGPNEDFDACIDECDGGKYSSKCTKKCYNEVYGLGVSKQTSEIEISYVDKLNSMVDAGQAIEKVADSSGKWDYNKKNELVWMPYGKIIANKVKRNGPGCTGKSNEHTCTTDAPWYQDTKNVWGTTGRYYYYNRWGMPATEECGDTCVWKGSACDGEYVNQDTANKDHEENQKIYDNLVAECKAAVSCTTTTATFTISVNYRNGSNKKVTIDFPYDKQTDKITSLGDNSTGTNTSGNANSTILSYAGCYKEGSSKNWYQTEWSFPGTWLNDKYGDISYKPITGKGWTEVSDKFCIPKDARDVNTKWWVAYYKNLYGNDPSYSYNDMDARSEFETECSNSIINSTGKSSSEVQSFTDSDAKDIDWNIKASAKKFGYFEWNIDIECFYALNRNYETPDSTNNNSKDNDEKKYCDNNNGEYNIRPVDLGNLFPSENTPKLASPNQTGRTPGFNWSKYAEQTKKDPKYISQPSKYTTWVQTKAYEVYSDRYLDYDIYLTKDVIKQIKNSNRNYTKWEGTVDVDSTTNYKSPLFRNGGVLAKDSKYPNAQALKCNNMQNYKSSECEDISKEVK